MNEIIFNKKSSRFEWDLDGQTAFLNYRPLDDTTWAYTYVFVPPTYRGQGYAAKITTFAMEYAEEKGIKVKPICPYIKAFTTKNKEKFEKVLLK
ncbi:GNAT family N-acetyltransferase [Membranihabitans maritimus]|uniref:GNAT family N-acetyltransferase n=1 Tax=Membranihabitans maritimus TaxID=2904244 RepID=UPI001F2FA9AA|nr:GNAT family N-acetyltransferase [Membranihabitans maritimus]